MLERANSNIGLPWAAINVKPWISICEGRPPQSALAGYHVSPEIMPQEAVRGNGLRNPFFRFYSFLISEHYKRSVNMTNMEGKNIYNIAQWYHI